MKDTEKQKPGLRLQVFISHSGVCSRRDAMVFVCKGRVSVNGIVVREPSTQIDPGADTVCLDGKTLNIKTQLYVILNKPGGYITTVEDKHAKKTVLDLLPRSMRYLHPVGRLDKNTEGLLLMTNDGDLTYRMTHPKFGVKKTYCVHIKGCLKSTDKKRLEKGIMLDGKMTAPSKITQPSFSGNLTQCQMIIHEGRKRQIRMMFQELGYSVVYLKRISHGPLKLGNLPIGKYRLLNEKEIKILKDTKHRARYEKS